LVLELLRLIWTESFQEQPGEACQINIAEELLILVVDTTIESSDQVLIFWLTLLFDHDWCGNLPLLQQVD